MDDAPDETPPTRPRLELVPPRRPPPTAVGAGTPDPLGRGPERRPTAAPEEPFLRFVEEAAVEYLELLGAGLARLVRPFARER